MQAKKNYLFFNTITPLILEVVTVISGFILPRLLLSNFGSDVNGLVQSVTQFLSIISFLELGVGNVVKYNLYKPLNNKDNEQLSRVIVAAKKFFRMIALALIAYTSFLMICYPLLKSSSFDHIYSALLIFVMAISSFSQYYFGQVNQLLLIADQKGYIQYTAQTLTVLANTIATVILINAGVGIHLVKLSTSLIFLIRPLFLQYYVRKKYHIDYKIKYNEEPIKQKWNGIAQHITFVILEHTDVLVLTLFTSLKDVSIYSAYYMVVNGIKKAITTSVSGIQAKLGAIIASDNKEELKKTFMTTEWIIHTTATFLFGCTIVLIVPFISIYTKGITDANYIVPLFAVLITLANASHSYRLPYSILIQSAGHYKQTQNSYIFAAAINIASSIIFVFMWGLVGVAIGTLVSMAYQTIWMAYYVYKNILEEKIIMFGKQIAIDVISITIIYSICRFVKFSGETYLSWLLYAIPIVLGVSCAILVINFIFFPERVLKFLKHLRQKT